MRTTAVQGCRRYARTRRRSSIPTTSCPLPTFSGGGSWAEPFLQTAHKRIGFGSPPALFRRWEGPPNAELCVGDPEPFPNAMHRVWWGSQVRNSALGDPGPFPTEGVRLTGCVKSGTGILPVGFRGIGVPPMLHGRSRPCHEKAASHTLSQGFAFLIPASSAGARSLLVPGTCDRTGE
jgi:hypothetical protein